jgi:hypothetical protein
VEVFIEMIKNEGEQLLIPRNRPSQMAVTGLLGQPFMTTVDARD